MTLKTENLLKNKYICLSGVGNIDFFDSGMATKTNINWQDVIKRQIPGSTSFVPLPAGLLLAYTVISQLKKRRFSK